jgi:anthraniloyl-CoA monooxygenase
MYEPAHEAAYARIVDFVHDHSTAKIGLQLGPLGRKGSTRLMWEGMDDPLPEGNWPGRRPIAAAVRSAQPRAAGADERRARRDPEQFVRATADGRRAGFDLLELHCAHGYLLSSFISPLANRRTDAYGGIAREPAALPVEVVRAMRAAWPEDRPMSVRISATDWADGGITADDAVEIARAFAQAGVDAIDVSTGQVLQSERPGYGRSYQTPYADRIRNVVAAPSGWRRSPSARSRRTTT